MINFLTLFFIFTFGTIVGSFLNVVILRYNTGRSIVSGRSACFSCNKQLEWFNLIPVFSFIFQNGKCGHCFSKISYQYLTVELLTAILFTLLYIKFGFNLKLLFYSLIFSILIIIAVYDFRHKIIPDNLVGLLGFTALSRLGYLFLVGSSELAISSFIGGVLMFLSLSSLWFFSDGRWMGLGDAKLILVLGWFNTIPQGFTALIYSFWLGALVGIFINLFFKKMKEIPFAPFLIAGFMVVFFCNSNLFVYLSGSNSLY